MKTKKTFLGVAVAIAVCTLAGCGNPENNSSNSSYGSSVEKTESFTNSDTKIPENVGINNKISLYNSFDSGMYHTGIITNDGNLLMWGDNALGQIGDKSEGAGGYRIGEHHKYDEKYDYDSINPYSTLPNVRQIALGQESSLAVTVNGELYIWGDKNYIIDDKSDKYYHSTPFKAMDNVKYADISSRNVAVITESNELYMWGENSFGQLQTGDFEQTVKPQKIMDNVVYVAIGDQHVHGAITEGGDLYMWGRNDYGQLGIDPDKSLDFEYIGFETKNNITPVKVMENVAKVRIGYYTTLALKENGELYSWGADKGANMGIGPLGFDIDDYCSDPTKILDNIIDFDTSPTHAIALTADGELYVWGSNRHAALGARFGKLPETPYHLELDIGKIVAVKTGIRNSLLLTDKGELYMCGSNEAYTIGSVVSDKESYEFVKVAENVVIPQ